MRISDWSSDVCSSDLSRISVLSKGSEKASMTSMPFGGHMVIASAPSCPNSEVTAPSAYSIGTGKSEKSNHAQNQPTKNITSDAMNRIEIGRASRREGVCQYV